MVTKSGGGGGNSPYNVINLVKTIKNTIKYNTSI